MCWLLRFADKVSHATVSGVRRERGEKVSRAPVPEVWVTKGMVPHMMVAKVCGKGVTCYCLRGLSAKGNGATCDGC